MSSPPLQSPQQRELVLWLAPTIRSRRVLCGSPIKAKIDQAPASREDDATARFNRLLALQILQLPVCHYATGCNRLISKRARLTCAVGGGSILRWFDWRHGGG
jgi:hypothetical protein